MDQDDTLAGLRVLDLAQGIAGSYAAKLFADAGADVIKIEQPGEDPIRRQGPFPADRPDPETGALWFYLNTNKRGITLNIETGTGRELFIRLVKGAHFVLESYRPGHMETLGLGYHSLREVNPALVMVSISPYGQTGPYRDYLATLGSLASLLVLPGRQAEGEGFEPPVGCPTAVFKTAAFGRSAIPPGSSPSGPAPP